MIGSIPYPMEKGTFVSDRLLEKQNWIRYDAWACVIYAIGHVSRLRIDDGVADARRESFCLISVRHVLALYVFLDNAHHSFSH